MFALLKDFARIEYITKRIIMASKNLKSWKIQRQQIMRGVFDGVLPTAEERNKYHISDTDVRDLEQFVPISKEYFGRENNKKLREHLRSTMRTLADEEEENRALYERNKALYEKCKKLEEDIERLRNSYFFHHLKNNLIHDIK
jgi:hypothetical protein